MGISGYGCIHLSVSGSNVMSLSTKVPPRPVGATPHWRACQSAYASSRRRGTNNGVCGGNEATTDAIAGP
eukprot:2240089-Lingulodinium_polyedra.AAC.1